MLPLVERVVVRRTKPWLSLKHFVSELPSRCNTMPCRDVQASFKHAGYSTWDCAELCRMEMMFLRPMVLSQLRESPKQAI